MWAHKSKCQYFTQSFRCIQFIIELNTHLREILIKIKTTEYKWQFEFCKALNLLERTLNLMEFISINLMFV